MSGHPFVSENGHNCDTCGANYHCPKCSDGCSMMGHLHDDEDGLFYGCQDAERYERWRSNWMQRRKAQP